MTESVGTPPLGAIALVSYVPDPLRSFLSELRHRLPGVHVPQPHVTLLPPRPLRQPAEVASRAIQSILDRFSGFTVELSRVRRFPETNFLYLDITEGSGSIHELHQALNTGELAYLERFEFRPHLTLAGPFRDDEIDQMGERAEAAWQASCCSRRIRIEELVCLWLPPHRNGRDWGRFRWYRLGNGDGQRQSIQGAPLAFTTQTS